MTKNALRASFAIVISVSVLAGMGCGEQPPATSTSPEGTLPAASTTTANPDTTTPEANTAATSSSASNPNMAEDGAKMGPPPPTEASEPTTGPTPFKPSGKIVKDPSGMEYDDMRVGTGPAPKSGQWVKVHYIGTLTNGTEFDASFKRNKPFEFQLDAPPGSPYGVIDGWDKAVSTMKVGGRRKVTVPPALAYGDREVGGGLIPANSTLVFDIELLGVSDTQTMGGM